MRIIFLDVDGVLNAEFTEDGYQGWVGIDPVLVYNLKKIYEESSIYEDTKIVIASSWRYEIIRKHMHSDGSYSYLIQKLREKGMEVLDTTGMDEIDGSYRGREIFKWLTLNKEKYNVTYYVILDDEEFDFNNYKDWSMRFVKIDSKYGINKEDITKAINILTLSKYKLDR